MRFLRGIIGKRTMAFFICIFLLAAHAAVISASQETTNQTVRAGIFYFDGYHMKDDNGNLSGYGIDFLNMASKYSHLNFEYSGYDRTWGDMIQMLEDGEIDIVTSARKIPEREAKFAFSLPIGKNSTILSVRLHETRFRNGNYPAYDGMRIGILAESSQNVILEAYAKEHCFSYQAFEYDNSEQLAAALKEGSIDAILSSDLRKRDGERTLDVLGVEDFYAIVRKSDTKLLAELNYAIEQMNLNDGNWTNELFYQYYAENQGNYDFTDREKAYIWDVACGKKKITMTASGSHAPYSYIKDGELTGILPDYFGQLMKMAGLSYETIVPEDMADYEMMMKTSGVDVIIDRRKAGMSSEETPHRGFDTDIYMTAGIAKVTRKDFKGKVRTIAYAQAHGDLPQESGLMQDAKILKCADREEALQAVFNGRADAAYVYIYTAQMLINSDITDSLRYSIVDNIRVDFRMHIRDTADHELVTILNKCIRRMPQDTLSQIIAQHTSYLAFRDLTFVQYMQANPGQVIVAILLVVIFALLIWQRWKGKLFEAERKSNQELQRQLSIVSTLSRDYLNVFAVNTKGNLARVVKIDGYALSKLTLSSDQIFSYTDIFSRYIRERVHPEDRQRLSKELSLAYVDEQLAAHPEYNGTYRIVEDGEVHFLQFTYAKIEAKGMQDYFTVLAGFHNIDEIVRKEQERNDILAEALASAQRANRAKTVFLSSMSHDIRTPMNAIIGFTSLAAFHMESRNLVQNYLDKIMTASRHLLGLMNNVLDMSRIESNQVKIEEQETSLPELMLDLKTIVQPDIEANGLTFSMDVLEIRDETVICDKIRLDQALLNILSNAIKFTKPGGTVSVRVIQDAGAPEGCALYRFQIKDTGIGMGKEFQKHIFEPFEREQTSTVSGIQGSGLGLAITKNIIDMMDGTIEVESEIAKGTLVTLSFCFRLADVPGKLQDAGQLSGLCALVVNGSSEEGGSIANMLSLAGMQPECVSTGTEASCRAEDAARTKKPCSIYVLDEALPDMDGIEAARRIKTAAGEHPVRIVLAADNVSDRELTAKEAGVTDICPKPVYYSELINLLAKNCKTQDETHQPGEDAASFEGKTILLAEDIELNQEIAKVILEEAGFVVDIAGDGRETVEKMEHMPGGTYDLILMDIQMPVMDGYEAARTIRAFRDPARASVPILALSANAFDEDRQKSIDAGMNGHIAKPIDISELLGLLRELFGRDLAKYNEGKP